MSFCGVFEKDRVYNARIITGFQKPNEHSVIITVHADAIRIGNLFDVGSSCMEPLCRSISEGGIQSKVTTEIGKYLWAKMLYNCALNPLGALLDVFYSRLVPDTAQHRSSMLQDIKAGKQTQIDALNGAVIELVKMHDIDVPYNSVGYNLVKFLEDRNC